MVSRGVFSIKRGNGISDDPVTLGSECYSRKLLGYIYDLVLLNEMVDFPERKSTTFGEFFRACSIFSGGAPIQEDPGRLFQGEPTEIEVTRLGILGRLEGKRS